MSFASINICSLCPNRPTIYSFYELDLATEAEAAKAELQNVRAELSCILLKPQPKNIPEESLEPRKLLLQMSQLFLIFVKQLVHKRRNYVRSAALTTPDDVLCFISLPVG